MCNDFGVGTRDWGNLMRGLGSAGRGRMCMSALVFGSGAALAQTPPPANGIEQVVVTAQHRPEYEKNVPIAVTSLSGRAVADLSVDGEDIRVLSAEVPGLYAESSFGRTYPRFYIRGLGNSDYTYNAQQPVSVVYDDVVEENSVLKGFPLFDVQDVEVLRGPQGTLFGRNTPAGVIKIASIMPTDEYKGYADINYGTYNTVNFSAGVGGAIVRRSSISAWPCWTSGATTGSPTSIRTRSIKSIWKATTTSPQRARCC